MTHLPALSWVREVKANNYNINITSDKTKACTECSGYRENRKETFCSRLHSESKKGGRRWREK